MKAGRIFFHNISNLKKIIHEYKILKPTFEYLKKSQDFFFSKHLLATNLTISVCFSAAGDAIEQIVEILSNEIDNWDRKRTAKLSATGLTVGILCHYWYSFLDLKYPHNTRGIVFKKILLNQVIFSPMCILLFFLTLGIVEQSKYTKITNDIQTKGKSIFLAELFIWPPASLINFYFVPFKFRVLYDSVTSLGFDIYNSYIVHKEFKKSQIKI
ncbi:unnamed protein product [Brachionus calyciflorus]|uniref:Mpv17-like protein 2 n=1 Tax=Brachionus calyciflorus TaxID=104777 RepID=A0A813Z413_9BILA|nr:unnamed protein product [Brachionus calyciflorus]